MTQEDAAREAALRAARAAVIKDERGRQGMSQQELATLTGLSRTYIGYIETARRGMSEDTLRAIARELGIKEARLRNPQSELWQAA